MSKTPSRPLSPHLQVYRPQLTSVLSFAHRVTGVTLGLYSIALVVWLAAAAAGSVAATSDADEAGSGMGFGETTGCGAGSSATGGASPRTRFNRRAI